MWRVDAIGEAGDPSVMAQVEAIFCESAATQSFASEPARAAYRDLWLGRYRERCPRAFLVAYKPGGEVIGYLAGAFISNREPLPGPDYYASFPAALIDAYPGHLHVNVRRDHRGRNVGSALIDAFRAICQAEGIGGFHAVTAAASPAAAFFLRCGLAERSTANWRGRPLAFLAETFR